MPIQYKWWDERRDNPIEAEGEGGMRRKNDAEQRYIQADRSGEEEEEQSRGEREERGFRLLRRAERISKPFIDDIKWHRTNHRCSEADQIQIKKSAEKMLLGKEVVCKRRHP